MWVLSFTVSTPKEKPKPTEPPKPAATTQLASSASAIQKQQQQHQYADYQANAGQQTYPQQNPMASYQPAYQSSYQSPSPYMYVRPGNTYHFTEYLPGSNPLSRASEMYSTYYAGQTRSNTKLQAKRPSNVRGGKRDVSGVPEFGKILEQALSASDGNLIVARQMVMKNRKKNSKRRKIWKKFLTRRRHKKKSRLPKTKQKEDALNQNDRKVLTDL